VFKITWKLSLRQKEGPQSSESVFLREGEGRWRWIQSLVANGMFQAWWPLKCSMLGGQWNVPSLMAIGMFHAWWPMECSKLDGHWKVKEKPFSPLPFSLNNFTYTLIFFPLISRFYFTMVLSRFPFLQSINYGCAPQHNKSFTPSLSIWYWLKI